jgi:hypothetical protein
MKPELDPALTALDDYVRGHLLDAEAERYEEELFGRALAGAAPELGFRDHVGRTLRVMAARGTLDMWLTQRGVERMNASGLRILHFELDLERPSLPDLSSDFDILITKVPIDLRGVHRLDAEILAPDGRLLKNMPDVSFDPDEGAVYACCEAELARAAAAARTITRLWVTDDSGRRLLRELPI